MLKANKRHIERHDYLKFKQQICPASNCAQIYNS